MKYFGFVLCRLLIHIWMLQHTLVAGDSYWSSESSFERPGTGIIVTHEDGLLSSYVIVIKSAKNATNIWSLWRLLSPACSHYRPKCFGHGNPRIGWIAGRSRRSPIFYDPQYHRWVFTNIQERRPSGIYLEILNDVSLLSPAKEAHLHTNTGKSVNICGKCSREQFQSHRFRSVKLRSHPTDWTDPTWLPWCRGGGVGKARQTKISETRFKLWVDQHVAL
jgi:hypothetical protein